MVSSISSRSLKAYCRATNLGEIQDTHIDHPSIARLYVQGVVDFIKSHYGWDVVWEENQPEEFVVRIQWTSTDRQLGIQALHELQDVLYTFAFKEKKGLYIYRVYWSDPGNYVEVGELESFVGIKTDNEFTVILNALKKNDNLRSLLTQINQYHSQTSMRSKVIIGYSLLEAYFYPDSEIPELLLFDVEKKDEVAGQLQYELAPYLQRAPLFKTAPEKAKEKLSTAINRMLSTKAKSPNEIMVEGISKLLGRREDCVRQELDILRSARGTLAHKLSPEMRDKFEQGLAFVDEVINKLVNQELARDKK